MHHSHPTNILIFNHVINGYPRRTVITINLRRTLALGRCLLTRCALLSQVGVTKSDAPTSYKGLLKKMPDFKAVTSAAYEAMENIFKQVRQNRVAI